MSGEDRDSTVIRVAFGVMETLAFVVGLPLALLSLMTLMVPFVTSVWVQLALAALVGLGIPLLIADRVLPKGQEAVRWAGVPTDVFAISWMLIAFVVMGVGGTATAEYMHKEADLLSKSALAPAGPLVRWVAGPNVSAAEGATALTDTASDAGRRVDAGDTGVHSDARGTDADAADDATSSDTQPDATDKTAPVRAEEGEGMSPAEVFEAAAPSVVSIGIKKGRRGQLVERGGGTGFFIDEEGTLVTNYHVIDGADGATIKLKDGRQTDEVDVLKVEKDKDIALLQIDPDELENEQKDSDSDDDSETDDIEPLPMGDSDDVRTGEHVVAIGNPLGLDYTLTDGIVSARRVWQDRKMIQISVPISPGNSGGPLLNMHGNVIGIATATVGGRWKRAQNLNLAVPINKVKPLHDGEYPNRRGIGESAPHKGTW